MTACAMTVGMVPMALALERGSQMQAPLGRAVIGGLVMSTVRHPAGRPLDLRLGDRPEQGADRRRSTPTIPKARITTRLAECRGGDASGEAVRHRIRPKHSESTPRPAEPPP